MGVRSFLASLGAFPPAAPSGIAQRNMPEAATGRRDISAVGSNAFGWRTGGSSSGTTLNADLIGRRAEFAASNNALAANGVAALTTALVGDGWTTVPGNLSPDLRRQHQTNFRAWELVADADGRTDYRGLAVQAVRSMVVRGEALVQFVTTPEGLRLRLIPSDMLDRSKTFDLLPGGGWIVEGVEFAADGTRAGYWIMPRRPGALNSFAGPSVRVVAADVLHLFRPTEPGQVRGLSWLAPVLVALNELDQLTDALLVGTKVAAMLAGFIEDATDFGTGVPFDGIQVGNTLEGGLEPGTIKVLPAGKKITFASPQQAKDSIAFLAYIVRTVSAGLGVPDYLVSNDLTGANYSSLRAGLVEFRRRIEQIQFGVLVPQLFRPVWQRWVATSALRGELPDARLGSASYAAADFYPPAWPWVDPQKDANAESIAIAAGLKSRRQAVAERGYDIEELDAEIAADRDREKTLGLNFTDSADAAAPAAPTPDPVPTDPAVKPAREAGSAAQ